LGERCEWIALDGRPIGRRFRLYRRRKRGKAYLCGSSLGGRDHIESRFRGFGCFGHELGRLRRFARRLGRARRRSLQLDRLNRSAGAARRASPPAFHDLTLVFAAPSFAPHNG
jgi:hypothetical protein